VPLDKSTERAKQALLLCVCTAAQVLFFYSNSAPKPQFALGLIAASILAKNLINPTVPYREASWIYNHFASIAQNHEKVNIRRRNHCSGPCRDHFVDEFPTRAFLALFKWCIDFHRLLRLGKRRHRLAANGPLCEQ
jgi:hypothetical protein